MTSASAASVQSRNPVAKGTSVPSKAWPMIVPAPIPTKVVTEPYSDDAVPACRTASAPRRYRAIASAGSRPDAMARYLRGADAVRHACAALDVEDTAPLRQAVMLLTQWRGIFVVLMLYGMLALLWTSKI